jgi:prolyl 4-hydroxylase
MLGRTLRCHRDHVNHDDDSSLCIPRIYSDQKLLWLVDGVLDERECTELIRRTSRMSTSGGGNVSYRDQDRFVFDDPLLADTLLTKLEPHLPARMGPLRLEALNSRFRLYRYRVGQRFMLHTDHWFAPTPKQITQHTVLFYLNENFEGGTTSFIGDVQDVVSPKTGRCAIFQHKLDHSGDEVHAGVKYLLRTDTIYCSDGQRIEVEGSFATGPVVL